MGNIDNKKSLVETYLVIVTLILSTLKNIPNTWLLFFVISILGYNAFLIHGIKDQKKIYWFAMVVGISFSSIIYYSLVIAFIECKTMNFPLISTLFSTTSSNIFEVSVNDGYVVHITKVVAMFFLGLIALFITVTLSRDENDNKITPLEYFKPKSEHLKWLILITIVIFFGIALLSSMEDIPLGLLFYLAGFFCLDMESAIQQLKDSRYYNIVALAILCLCGLFAFLLLAI